MTKKNKEEVFLKKTSKILKIAVIIIGLILVLIYGIKGGFYSLIFDLRESKTTIIYSIVIIILLCALVFLNLSDEDEANKKWEISSYITVGVIILILFFAVLLLVTLLDFFLPIIVLSAFLIIMYYGILSLITLVVNKYGIK